MRENRKKKKIHGQKQLSFAMLLVLMLCVTACSSKGSTTETSPHTQQQETVSEPETSSEETIPTEAEELQETADEEETFRPNSE